MESSHEQALKEIEDVFGERSRRGGSAPPGVSDAGDALAYASPMSVEEMKLLADVAGRYSVPLVAMGAGTASRPNSEAGGILIHFDLMRTVRLPGHEEPWVEAEPGASWLQLDDLLRAREWGLAVYRRADADVPFGAAFGSANELTGAVASIAEVGLSLWHLAFLNPAMAHARNLGDAFMLFGAYPAERRGEIEGDLRSVVVSSRGRDLSAAEAHRAWGERFFPVTPSALPPRFPALSRDLVSLVDLPQKLGEAQDRPGNAAIQGTVARSKEVLLLSLEDHEEGAVR